MSDARTAILGRVDRARRTARIPDVPSPSRAARGAASARSSLVDRFLAEATLLGVETFVESTDDAVVARVRQLTAGRRVHSWSPDRLPYGAGAAIPQTLTGAASRDELAAAEIGVTGCHGALAETGSLALLSRPGCPRTASLLPPVHVAIVRPEDIFETMGDFFAANADAIASSASCTFVTGPSRTADIELSLTIGVHGPGRVVVIVGPQG